MKKKIFEGFETTKMSFLNNFHLEIFEKMAFFGKFWEKNGNVLAIFEKKMAICLEFLDIQMAIFSMCKMRSRLVLP